eukprot:TRINITY_DN2880_c0_g1_i1.p1 TRINITY_DN2880_c0_g1~~TRINITY_DN2880_c0_g1_i1.p1  ORF type:complete len:190 (+),score=84.07 TRINITY_DN2880_c0_g1_i1:106-675(+)
MERESSKVVGDGISYAPRHIRKARPLPEQEVSSLERVRIVLENLRESPFHIRSHDSISGQRHPVWDYMTTRAAYFMPEEILPESLAKEIRRKAARGVEGKRRKLVSRRHRRESGAGLVDLSGKVGDGVGEADGDEEGKEEEEEDQNAVAEEGSDEELDADDYMHTRFDDDEEGDLDSLGGSDEDDGQML